LPAAAYKKPAQQLIMKVRNASHWAPRGRRRWLIALGALAVAGVLRFALHPLLGPVMPGTPFAIAAALVEYYLGLAPALTVMALGLGIADYWFVPPYANITVFDRHDVFLLVSYPLVTLIVITLIERLRREQFRAQLIASVAQSRYEMLLRHDNERALARRAVDETHRLLHHLTQHHHGFILIKALERDAAARASVGQSTAWSPGEAEGVAPGPLYDAVHPEDVQRITYALWPGSHRVRLRRSQHEAEFRLTPCRCERFTTHAGDFLVLRTEH
jgi:K+-sensing histidine kinase KdpD